MNEWLDFITRRLGGSRHSPDFNIAFSQQHQTESQQRKTYILDMASSPQGSKDGPWTEETKQKFESKSKSEFYDPCQEAAQRSYKCLYRNNGDKSMCGDYFQYVARAGNRHLASGRGGRISEREEANGCAQGVSGLQTGLGMLNIFAGTKYWLAYAMR
ncbi:hypothetical protein J3F83DRAFT_595109 [Trichoderma novae-zelandiae]